MFDKFLKELQHGTRQVEGRNDNSTAFRGVVLRDGALAWEKDGSHILIDGTVEFRIKPELKKAKVTKSLSANRLLLHEWLSDSRFIGFVYAEEMQSLHALPIMWIGPKGELLPSFQGKRVEAMPVRPKYVIYEEV